MVCGAFLLRFTLLSGLSFLDVSKGALDECIEGHNFSLSGITVSYRNGTLLNFLSTDYQHVGDTLNLLSLTDLVADLFAALVDLNADTLCLKLLVNFAGIVHALFGYGQNLYLNRCQPGGELACVMLGDDADETLDRAVAYTVDHDGTLLLAVFVNILKLEVERHLEVELDGAALPGSADGVMRWKSILGP